jgi:guanylate kinase
MKGTLYIVSAPSGTGKTSLVKALIDAINDVKVSVSHTTRGMRPAELEGINYHFVDLATFEKMKKEGEFLETATMYGNEYGTSKTWVNEVLDSGLDVILEIEWRGAKQVIDNFPDAVPVFILPPNLEALSDRLKARGQDQEDVIEHRFAQARDEVHHCADYKYIVVNDQFEVALADLRSIIRAERCLRERQLVKQEALLKTLA